MYRPDAMGELNNGETQEKEMEILFLQSIPQGKIQGNAKQILIVGFWTRLSARSVAALGYRCNSLADDSVQVTA